VETLNLMQSYFSILAISSWAIRMLFRKLLPMPIFWSVLRSIGVVIFQRFCRIQQWIPLVLGFSLLLTTASMSLLICLSCSYPLLILVSHLCLEMYTFLLDFQMCWNINFENIPHWLSGFHHYLFYHYHIFNLNFC
jgi:hypothetical protein